MIQGRAFSGVSFFNSPQETEDPVFFSRTFSPAVRSFAFLALQEGPSPLFLYKACLISIAFFSWVDPFSFSDTPSSLWTHFLRKTRGRL